MSSIPKFNTALNTRNSSLTQTHSSEPAKAWKQPTKHSDQLAAESQRTGEVSKRNIDEHAVAEELPLQGVLDNANNGISTSVHDVIALLAERGIQVKGKKPTGSLTTDPIRSTLVDHNMILYNEDQLNAALDNPDPEQHGQAIFAIMNAANAIFKHGDDVGKLHGLIHKATDVNNNFMTAAKYLSDSQIRYLMDLKSGYQDFALHQPLMERSFAVTRRRLDDLFAKRNWESPQRNSLDSVNPTR